MDNQTITRYEVRGPVPPIHWEGTVPGSKSMTNRAMLMAALADAPVCLTGALFSEDTRVCAEALRVLGFDVREDEAAQSITVRGEGGRIPRAEAAIHVGASGTAARFLTVLLGVSAGTYRIDASPQMRRRPMRPLFAALAALGADIVYLGEEGHLPVQITGAAQKGPLTLSRVDLNIDESTQFLSAFLLAAPCVSQGLCLHITGEKRDGPYIRMTCAMMRARGVEVTAANGTYILPAGARYVGGTYAVEPDVSAACYFYAAAAVTGGYARVNGVYAASLQGDLAFLEVLRRMGCTVVEEPAGIAVQGPAVGTLRGLSVDMRDFSDQALTLAAIAPYADGPVKITGIAHTRGQESDRVHAMADNLTRAGIACREFPDGVEISPGQPRACVIDSHGDHRVAMAFAVMGLRAEGIVIDDPACCAKTFENYFELLDAMTRPLA